MKSRIILSSLTTIFSYRSSIDDCNSLAGVFDTFRRYESYRQSNLAPSEFEFTFKFLSRVRQKLFSTSNRGLARQISISEQREIFHLSQPLANICEAISEEMTSEIDSRAKYCPNGSCDQPYFLTAIWNYGCWCNFGRNLMAGRGVPVDSFDALCKKFQLCVKCNVIDAREEGFACNPKTTSYYTKVDPQSETLQRQDCSTQNPNDLCAVYGCSCDTQLIDDFIDKLLDPNDNEKYTNSTYLHKNGFDRLDLCEYADEKDGGSDGDEELKCCGYYPNRIPYRDNIQNECCDNGKDRAVLINTFQQQCCLNGGSAPIGTC